MWTWKAWVRGVRAPLLGGCMLAALVAASVARGAPGDTGADSAPLEDGFTRDVNRAIDRGIAWLKSAQQEDGSWGPCVSSGVTYQGTRVQDPRCYHTGPTSFALFTLAQCGVGRREPVMRRGLKWLRKKARRGADVSRKHDAYPYSSYESASVILMLTALYDEGETLPASRSPARRPRGSAFRNDDWLWLHERVGHLVGGRGREAFTQRPNGGWGYRSRGSNADVSATQFAHLALREAVRAGYPLNEVRADVWTSSLGYLLRLRAPHGGMPYDRAGGPASAGMTAAALSSFLIIREQLQQQAQPVPRRLDAAIEKAYAYLGSRWSPVINFTETEPEEDRGVNANIGFYHYCHLYAIERVGALGGRKLLGERLWYPLGADRLLVMQLPDGKWVDTRCMAPADVLGTCFALLFLERATPPAVITPRSD